MLTSSQRYALIAVLGFLIAVLLLDSSRPRVGGGNSGTNSDATSSSGSPTERTSSPAPVATVELQQGTTPTTSESRKLGVEVETEPTSPVGDATAPSSSTVIVEHGNSAEIVLPPPRRPCKKGEAAPSDASGGGTQSSQLKSEQSDADIDSVLASSKSTSGGGSTTQKTNRYGQPIGMTIPRLSKKYPNPKVFTSGDSARVDWGNIVETPLLEGQTCDPDWCDIEGQGEPPRRAFVYDPKCKTETLHQGNFTNFEDMVRFTQRFPFPSRTAFKKVGKEEVAQYWRDNPDPINLVCKMCRGELAHTTLYSLRRWWRLRGWRLVNKTDGEILRMKESVLTLFEDRFAGVHAKLVGGDFDRPPTESFGIPLEEVISIRMCREADVSGSKSFVAIETIKEVHVFQFVLPRAGVACFWRTLQLLHPALAKRTVEVFDRRSGDSELQVCPDYDLVASRMAKTMKGKVIDAVPPHELPTGGDGNLVRLVESPSIKQMATMPLDTKFPYLPCHRFQLTKLYHECERLRCYDSYKNFWPFKCDRHRVTNYCGWDPRYNNESQSSRDNLALPSSSSAEKKKQKSKESHQNIRAAVTFSGFFRSFPSARGQIWEMIVKPHNATVFGVTWNVVGRAKKTIEITKKHCIPVPKMMQTVREMLFFDERKESHEGRIEIYEYLRLAKHHQMLKQNGFTHPGLYFTLARSIALVKDWEEKHGGDLFDIVIRTRFDIWPSVPLRFVRAKRMWPRVENPEDIPLGGLSVAAATALDESEDRDSHEYTLDVGSSCKTQGAWWPQYLKFFDGKILKHNADTRYKLWTWQVCDWIEIGTKRTIYESAKIFDWAQEYNVWSGAQFIEHGFYIDRGISYQPVQLFLKIMRHKSQFFG